MEPGPRTAQLAHQPLLTTTPLCAAFRRQPRSRPRRCRPALRITQRCSYGGVISPVLLNVALHGMEQAAGARYLSSGSITVDSPALIRYADDFVVHCHTRQDALEIKARLATWLASRGLSFNEDKTHVVSLDEGFDFLGFNVRRYRGTPLIKPSKAAIRRIRERLRDELRPCAGPTPPR